jgi:hypothetical protein
LRGAKASCVCGEAKRDAPSADFLVVCCSTVDEAGETARAGPARTVLRPAAIRTYGEVCDGG